jgi:hypothetical protein
VYVVSREKKHQAAYPQLSTVQAAGFERVVKRRTNRTDPRIDNRYGAKKPWRFRNYDMPTPFPILISYFGRVFVRMDFDSSIATAAAAATAVVPDSLERLHHDNGVAANDLLFHFV